MRRPFCVLLAVAAAAGGFVAGRLFDRPAATVIVNRDEPAAKTARDPQWRTDDEPWAVRERARAERDAIERASPGPEDDEEAPKAGARVGAAAGGTDDTVHDDGEEPTTRTRRELVSACEGCLELLGDPVEPKRDVHERFSGSSVSGAVRQAIQQTGVTGDVEGVDCSEFPCIVFARLAGDEEDIEEIERSAALDPYEGDVLTLLLWATTVDEEIRTHPSAKETGLFALAYYDFDDRDELGVDLDRRIRARVLEVWNEERPGPPDSAPR